MPRIPPAILLALVVTVAPTHAVAAGAGTDATAETHATAAANAATETSTTAATAASTPALAPLTSAATAPAPDSRGMNDTERRAYSSKLREAQALVERKRYADAIAILDQLTAKHPHEPQARFIKGVALMDGGQTEDAIAQYRALASEFPELPEPHNNLAVLYAAKGEYALARDELLRAIEAAPDYAIAHENLGDVYVRLAEIEYRRTVSLDKANRSVAARLDRLKKVESTGAQSPTVSEPPAVAQPPAGTQPSAVTSSPANSR